jgi:hypothetical protein
MHRWQIDIIMIESDAGADLVELAFRSVACTLSCGSFRGHGARSRHQHVRDGTDESCEFVITLIIAYLLFLEDKITYHDYHTRDH